jgi:hypothetical protein
MFKEKNKKRVLLYIYVLLIFYFQKNEKKIKYEERINEIP